MLHKEIPFLRIVIPVCAGIISGLYTETGLLFLLTALLLIAASLTFIMLFNSSLVNISYGLILTLALTVCGYLLYSNEKNRISELEQEKCVIICTLSDFPEEKENSYKAKVKLLGVYDTVGIKTVNGSMLFYIKKDSSLTALLPGDILKISCIPAEIVNRGNPCEFDYRFYMQNQGIRFMSFINSEDIIDQIIPGKRNITHKALIIRQKIIEMYSDRGISGRKLALVAAMTVGEKSLLEPDQKENFIRAGVMHIMAVSGLHAVVLSLFVFNLLFFLKRRFNILRILIALIVLWAFAFVTGLTPSVMRATLMFSFIQLGNLMKRPANSLNSVLASAFVLILIRPSVIFDAGFLLSYSAVIFIILFYRTLYLKLQLNNWLADKIWQSIVVTIVAQAGTLPLTVMLFNRFPVYFLLTNVIIVPLSSLIIIAGCLLPLLYPLGFISLMIGAVLNYTTGLTEFLTEMAASLPGSTIAGLGMTVSECILLTGILALFCSIVLDRQFRFVRFLLSLILIISFTDTCRSISIRKTNELIVYNSPGKTVVGIRTGKILNLYSTGEDIPVEVSRHCSTLDLTIKDTNHPDAVSCIDAEGRKILISGSVDRTMLSSLSPDIVILTGSKPHIEDIGGLQKYPGMFILSSEVSSGFRLPGTFSSHFIMPVISIRKSGAVTMDL